MPTPAEQPLESTSSRRPGRRHPRLCAAWILAALLLPAACREGSPPRLPGRPNVLLVTCDTLRADHLGCYGYYRDTSPRIDAFAAEGVRVERAVATMTTTLPSHLSILTGLFAHQHGYVANQGAIRSAFSPTPGRRSIAQFFREAGYRTAAFVSGPTVSHLTGIDAGFEHFDDHDPRDASTLFERSRPGRETTEHALAWLRDHTDEPWFVWIHYWDPHEPNVPPEPYASMFPPDEGLERLIDARRIEPERLRVRFDDLELSRLFAPELTPRIAQGETVELPPIDRDAIRRLLCAYDGDVRYVDDCFGAVLDELDALGLEGRTVVAFVADHGQSLGQHDWLEHGEIRQDNAHVPLILRFPDDLVPQPAVVPGPVSLVDLMPTIVARLDVPPVRAFLAQAEGADFLSPAFDRPFAFTQRSVRERAEWPSGLEFGVTTREYTFYDYTQHPDELYDLRRDPGEFENVIGRFPREAQGGREWIRQTLARRPYQVPEGPHNAAAEEFRRALKDLGYLGEEN